MHIAQIMVFWVFTSVGGVIGSDVSEERAGSTFRVIEWVQTDAEMNGKENYVYYIGKS